jgi:hypothetical protein
LGKGQDSYEEMAKKESPFRLPLLGEWHSKGAPKTSEEEPNAEHDPYNQLIPPEGGHDLTDHDKLDRYRGNAQGQQANPKPSLPHHSSAFLSYLTSLVQNSSRAFMG